MRRRRAAVRARWAPAPARFIAAAAVAAAILPASAADGRLAIALLERGELQFRATDGAVLSTIPTGEGPRAIAVGDGRVLVANRGLEDRPGSSMTLVDASSMAVERTVKVCEACAPRDVAFDGRGRLWFTGQAHRAVYWMEEGYDDPSGSVLVGAGWPVEIAAVPGTDLMLVGSRGASTIAVVDTVQKSARLVEAGPYPALVFGGPAAMYAASDSGGPLVRVELRDGESDLRVLVESVHAASAVLAGGGSRLVVADRKERALLVLDAVSGAELSRTTLDGTPAALAVSPDGRAVAVASRSPHRVELLSLAAEGGLKRAGSFEVEDRIGDLAWLP